MEIGSVADSFDDAITVAVDGGSIAVDTGSCPEFAFTRDEARKLAALLQTAVIEVGPEDPDFFGYQTLDQIPYIGTRLTFAVGGDAREMVAAEDYLKVYNSYAEAVEELADYRDRCAGLRKELAQAAADLSAVRAELAGKEKGWASAERWRAVAVSRAERINELVGALAKERKRREAAEARAERIDELERLAEAERRKRKAHEDTLATVDSLLGAPFQALHGAVTDLNARVGTLEDWVTKQAGFDAS